LLHDEGWARYRTPLILAAVLLAPAPLWRPATIPIALRITVPLAVSFCVVKSIPQLRLEPPPSVGVIVIKGSLAACMRHLATTVHGWGAKKPRERARRGSAPQPLENVEEGSR
jgi:hypothetical protein